MGWPEYTYLALVMMGVGISMAKHGQPREGNHNFFVTIFLTGIVFFLLYMGGFFS